MATFYERAYNSVDCMFFIFVISVIFDFWFENRIWVLIKQVPGHFLLVLRGVVLDINLYCVASTRIIYDYLNGKESYKDD